jgi:transcriptional regulator with XRE-family HTH domain
MRTDETFAMRLRRLRRERAYTIEVLAALARTTPRALRSLESGTRAPTFLVGLRLAEALHVDAEYLALGESSSDILVKVTAALSSRQLDAVDHRATVLGAPRAEARLR